MTQNRRYAVTGGIGSGKSVFCELLKKRGYPVFSCDEISALLWQDPEYRDGLSALFPEYTVRGEIVKSKLSEAVFLNESALNKLNTYSHAKIMARLFALTEQTKISFCEVPLLFENGLETRFGGVIVLTRDRESRIRSVADRSNLTRQEVLARIKTQFDYSRLPLNPNCKCVVVQNDGSREDLGHKLSAVLSEMGLALYNTGSKIV